jgi:hypothetical protein
MAVSKSDLLRLQNSSLLRKELNILIRWRILTAKGGKARIVAYQDSRDVQKVLDYVCGPENWSNEPRNLGGKLYMTIGINTADEGWVYKNDVGIESNIEATKGESSDAFKRAAVMWGIFRDIYEYDYIVLDFNGKYPVTPEKMELKTSEAINLYCNSISEPMNHLRKLYFSIKDRLHENEEIIKVLEQLKKFINETAV